MDLPAWGGGVNSVECLLLGAMLGQHEVSFFISALGKTKMKLKTAAATFIFNKRPTWLNFSFFHPSSPSLGICCPWLVLCVASLFVTDGK